MLVFYYVTVNENNFDEETTFVSLCQNFTQPTFSHVMQTLFPVQFTLADRIFVIPVAVESKHFV